MFHLVLFLTALIGVLAAPGDHGHTVDPMDSTCHLIRDYHCEFFLSDPVCGTDGITYNNMCEFSKAHCQVNTLHVAHEGVCTDTSGGSTMTPGSLASYQFFCQSLAQQACGQDLQVVCGSDGNTYNNLCLFEKARCANNDLIIADYQACPN